MPDVFLSYSREDAEAARRFADAFGRAGLAVWWDATLRSGEAYDEVTERALRTARAVVVLWSRASVESRWVRAEATLADRRRTLVPAMIEACERPIMFELTQTADLSRWGGDERDGGWIAFVRDVRRMVQANGEVSEASRPAPAEVPVPMPAPRVRDLRPGLAILPFTNRSSEAADDVFADGMVEDLIAALSSSSAVRVIAQSATVVYRRNASDLRSIGQELNVRYILEGNVRRAGVNLRVTAQLNEAATGAILWTQRFDRPLTDLAELQEQLVIEVATHLGVQVERIEMEKALEKPGDLTAWEAVMRSLAATSTVSAENMVTALKEARHAVAVAPHYALAQAVLGWALANTNFTTHGGGNEPMRREALQHTNRAVELGGNDPITLGWAAMTLTFCGNHVEAQSYAQRSLAINPNNSTGHHALALVFLRLDRPEEALVHADAALALAPRGYLSYLFHAYQGVAHFTAGRNEDAYRAAEQSIRVNPAFNWSWKDKAVYSEHLGHRDEARAALRRLREIDHTISLASIEAHLTASFIAPRVAAQMNATMAMLWQDTFGDSALT